jgi:hypothetical protein
MISSTSQVTVGDARAALSWVVNPRDANDEAFLSRLNLARNRIINEGRWLGCTLHVVFDGSTGYITLPPHMSSVVGVTINGCPTISFTRDYNYGVFGPGTFKDSDITHGIGFLIDAGDHFVTSIDHTEGQQLRFVLSSAEDVDTVVRVFGTDVNGDDIFDEYGFAGQDLTLTSAATVFPTALNKFTGFQKCVGAGTMTVQSWDGVTATNLQVYQPWETRPRYKRYYTGQYQATIPIGCLTRLRYTPVYAETDFVIPGSLGALLAALQAMDQEESRNDATAEWNRCYTILNDEFKNSRGKAIPNLEIISPNPTNFYVN